MKCKACCRIDKIGCFSRNQTIVCPFTYPRDSLKEVGPGLKKPYVFGGRPSNCTGCNLNNLKVRDCFP